MMHEWRGRAVSVLLLMILSDGLHVLAMTEITELGDDKYRVVFRYHAPAGALAVYLAGSFNGWNPHGTRMEGPDASGAFTVIMVLPKGRHEYKFVIDGKIWQTDPDNPHRTEGYGNAVLYAGIDSIESERPARPPTGPRTVAHPTQILKLAAAIDKTSASQSHDLVSRWFDAHSMPWFTDAAVSFVCRIPDATSVRLLLGANGSIHGILMGQVVEGRSVFAVSLDRRDVAERSAYVFEVEANHGSRIEVDPNSWSLTSRAGRPASLVAEASDDRGRIEVIQDVEPSVPGLGARDVYVYLPPGYDLNDEARYPVLYLHDGQNCWDDPVEPFGHGGWCVNLTADRLIRSGQVRAFIGVGMANTAKRMEEYGPGPDILSDAHHAYIQLLKNDVKPLIDRTYRTKQDPSNTALMGSSMGGIISLKTALLNPGLFGQAACLSPAFLFKDSADLDYLDLVRAVGKQPVRLYLDSGTAGEKQDGAPATRKMVELLLASGWSDGVDLSHFEDTGAEHNERAWRARVDKPLRFLFGRSAETVDTIP